MRTERLTPSMVRVVLGGEGLAGFTMPDGDPTDAYVNLAFPPAGASYGPVFDPKALKDLPREEQPVRRRYTVRDWDADAGELTVDFVVHGDAGVAGPWALGAQPGDVLVLQGPSGGYRPRQDAERYLMVGDESAIPAIAASAAVVPAGRPLTVLLVCDGPEHELPITTEADLDLRWLHRSADPGSELADELRTIDLPAGADVCTFVHGEAEEIRAIRKHLLTEVGMSRADMSCSPYWRRTMDDEAWRAVKKDFVAAMEQDA
ncbi:siderophore-interacting protein [Nocardioides sp. CFH 31398]|uniref:siderophore-interacting protein n=1 Tax=Nocardioides sp. CFH 31398 TaxID=2919579 RepID=UPI001F05A819|nr:siderophore-interacting protein [Nocardioides sp. CFH 31398]MCH1866369.1 siderophore-interacting protein [Nocardioides sp. CFH 31398]